MRSLNHIVRVGLLISKSKHADFKDVNAQGTMLGIASAY